MAKYFDKLFHAKFRKSYFLKMFILYILFTLVAVSLVSFFLLTLSTKKIQEKTNKVNLNFLAQVQIYADTYIVNKVQSLVTENFLYINPSTDMGKFFYSNSNTLYNQYSLQQLLSQIKINNDFIQSIYIYSKTCDTLISSNEGIIFNAAKPNSIARNSSNIDLILNKLNDTNPQKQEYWISPLQNKDFYTDMPIISFARELPVFSGNSPKLGFIVININAESFISSLGKISDTPSGDLMIVDLEGNTFAHSNKSKLFDNLKNNEMLKIFNGQSGTATIKNNQNEYVGITYIESPANHWKYVSVVSIQALNKDLNNTKQVAYVFIALSTIFIVFVLIVATLRLYKPIKNLIDVTEEKLNIESTDNELEFINKVISNLSTKVKNMQETIQNSNILVESKIAGDILYGNVQSSRKNIEKLKLLDKLFIHSYYTVILIEMNDEIFDKLSSEQKELLNHSIVEFVNTFFSKDYTCITTSTAANRIATITNHEYSRDILKAVNEFLSIIEKDFGMSFNIALSESTNNFMMIHKLYADTINYLNYSFIYGYSNIFTSEIIAGYETSHNDFNEDKLEQIESLLKAQKFELLKEEIENVFIAVKERGCSYHFIQNILLQTASLICKISRDQNIISNELDKHNILLELNNVKSLDLGIQWLFNILDIYFENMKNRNSLIDHDFITKISEYISNHIDHNLSLDSVAEKFAISSGHLSKIFKENFGINFSIYVIDKKFDKATKLLLEEKDLDISQIAEKVGYSNLPYFSKLFKERYGVTPLQYRKMNM